jgi:type I restriction enzyme S subunit
VSAVLEAREPSARYLAAEQPTLVRQFGLLATAPGGVARLRELILSLAVRGRLVQQNLADEPASAMLARLVASRSKGRKQGISADAFDVANCDPSTFPCDLPAGWAWIRLSDLGEFCGGKTPSKQNPTYWSGSIPWITPKDMKQLRLADSEDHVSPAAIADGLAPIPRHSLLIVVRSGILRRTVPVAINEVETTINQDLKALKLTAPEMVPYLQLLVRGFERFILETLTKVGTTVESIRFDDFAAQPFPLPPAAEQARIVACVAELMRLCDALEAKGQLEAEQHARLLSTLLGTLTDSSTPEELAANWQRVGDHFDLLLDRPEAVDALEQTILQLAVRGLLVPQDPSQEPGVKNSHRSLDTPEEPIDENELPFDVPANWRWVRLGSQAELINGDRGKNYPNRAEYVATGVPFINTGHIEPDGTLSHDSMHHLTRAKFESLRSGKTRSGDLVYCLRGATLGKTAIVEYPEGAIASSLVILRFKESVNRRFAFLFLTSPFGRELIRRFDNGSAQPNLAASSVARYVMPLPPLEEQSRIVTRITELRSFCADLRQRLTASQVTQSHLAETLVDEVA